MTVPVTPLRKHHGHNGGLVALGMLAVTSAVVWTTQPHGPPGARPAEKAKPAMVVATPAPAALAASVPKPAPLTSFDLRSGIKTVVVGEGECRRIVTATGQSSYDEKRTNHVATPVSGWLEKTRPRSLARRVRSGETLGIIYSAEVYLATTSLVEQVKNFRSQELLDAERMRLYRWGMLRQQIARIEQTRRPESALPLIARVPGIVVAEEGSHKQFVEAGSMELFTITEPSYAWVYVDLLAADAARVSVGMPARLTVEGIKQPVTANIAYVYRRVEDGKRAVRFDVFSPYLRIRPDLAVKAELQLPAERMPTIPVSAVNRDGDSTVVYLARGPGSVEVREVTLGATKGGTYCIQDGLLAGETIAADARQALASKR
ncbi:MAG TPA: efflux RND transporter periplasmic adaptor subunit [Kofleriaceae bacterium]|nr:efflux RND transporter periplasmic adaptor subunit [Kofleriaceae bacterium]